MSVLPVMRPKLPSTDLLLPYLRMIDGSRVYSNFGPLSAWFEKRMAAHFGVSEHSVTTVANGTLGLALALAAQGARPGTLCIIPGWTFVASAQAAVIAGLVPYFVDVNPSTWALDPDAVAGLIDGAPREVGAVMPVAPFGRPVDFPAWDRFRLRTGLPVVIDAAAGFDALTPTETPAVVSLHATKVLGIGEGGIVVSTNPSFIREIRTRANFGFDGKREAIVSAFNAKLSEYHAAVGHAALDEWSLARAEWQAVGRNYVGRLAHTNVRLQSGFGESWISSVCVLHTESQDAVLLEDSLQKDGIDTRRWWGYGAHIHPSTVALPRTALPVTEQLAKSTIAVPFFRDMTAGEIDRVADCALGSQALYPRCVPESPG